MPVPVPSLQQFSVGPGLSAYMAGSQARVQREERERLEQERQVQRYGAAAALAENEEQWGRWWEAASQSGLFSPEELESVRNFETGRNIILGQAGPDVAFQAANLDLNREQFALQRQAFAAEQARANRPGPRDMREDQNGVLRYVDTGEPVFPGVETAPNIEDIPGLEGDLRTEFDRLTSEFRVVDNSYQRVQSVAADPSAAGDLALIFSFMKMLDPNSVVRETEFANAQNAAGVPDIVRNVWNRLMSGERLAPEQRADFLSQAANLYGAVRQGYDQTAEYYRGLAENYQVNPGNVVMDRPDPTQPAPPPPPLVPPAPGGGGLTGTQFDQRFAPQSGPAVGDTATNTQTGQRVRWNGTAWEPI